jgi:hypothetical protein
MSNVQQLTLHIGLPKTATTTLQKHVLRRFPGYLDKHLDGGDASLASERDAWRWAFEGWVRRNPDWRDAVRVWFSTMEHTGHPQVLLSEEDLSGAWPVSGTGSLSPFFDAPNVERVRPHPVIEFLKIIRKCGGGKMRLRVILTLRNQPDLMGSLYAEQQSFMASAGQADLEAKIARSLGSDDPFFDFATLVDELEAELGAEDCLVLLYEDGLAFNVSRIEAFLEGRALKTAEIFDSDTSLAIARGLARFHGASLPTRKARDWASRTMHQCGAVVAWSG